MVTVCMPSMPAIAANWEFTPTLSIAEIYSDNVILAPPGQEDEDFVTDLSPGFSLQGEGRRLNAALDYRFQQLLYSRDSNRNKNYHQLNGSAEAELITNTLFLNTFANISQYTQSTTQLNIADNISVVGDRSTVRTAGVSPSYRHSFSGGANLVAGYGYNIVRYDDGPSDSDIHGFNVTLESGERFTLLEWRLRYASLREDREAAERIDRNSVSGQMRYRMTRTLSVLAEAGQEKSNFGAAINLQEGSYWAAGVALRPSPRLEVGAMSGYRFKTAWLSWTPSTRSSVDISWQDKEVGFEVGRDWTVTIEIGSQNTRWNAAYSEGLTTTQQEQLSGSVFIDAVTGELVINPQPGQLVIPVDNFIVTDEVFLNKRATASVEHIVQRITLALLGFYETRELVVSDGEETRAGAILSSSLRVTPHTRLLLNSGYEIYEPTGEVRDTLWYVGIGPTRRLGRNAAVNLMYRYAEQDSELDENGYRENRVMLRVDIRF